MCKTTRMFELAKRIARKSTHPAHQLGCVIAKGGNVLSVGFNQIKEHPRSLHPWKMQHAEFCALLGLKGFELNGADLYVYRETKNGQCAMSKPCKYCTHMISQTNIRRVYYSNIGGFEYYLNSEI